MSSTENPGVESGQPESDRLELILAAVGDGGRTHQIARRISVLIGYATLRRGLLKLEGAGRVERDPMLSFVNSIWWRPIVEGAEHQSEPFECPRGDSQCSCSFPC